MSLHLWFVGEKLQFFFSNLPKQTWNSPTTDVNNSPGNCSSLASSTSQVIEQYDILVKKGRGRKRRCDKSTPDNKSTPIEQPRNNYPASETVPSYIEDTRDYSVTSVPCSNSFEALSNTGCGSDLDAENSEDCFCDPTDDGQVESTTIEDSSGVTLPLFSCKDCTDVLSVVENTSSFNNYAYCCCGKLCSEVIAKNPDVVFYKYTPTRGTKVSRKGTRH